MITTLTECEIASAALADQIEAYTSFSCTGPSGGEARVWSGASNAYPPGCACYTGLGLYMYDYSNTGSCSSSYPCLCRLPLPPSPPAAPPSPPAAPPAAPPTLPTPYLPPSPCPALPPMPPFAPSRGADSRGDTDTYCDAGDDCCDRCAYANDGVCDDGFYDRELSLHTQYCRPFTDCMDCGRRVFLCGDYCIAPNGTDLSNDGKCDDGGAGATHSTCLLGMDCSDCFRANGGSGSSSANTLDCDVSKPPSALAGYSASSWQARVFCMRVAFVRASNASFSLVICSLVFAAAMVVLGAVLDTRRYLLFGLLSLPPIVLAIAGALTGLQNQPYSAYVLHFEAVASALAIALTTVAAAVYRCRRVAVRSHLRTAEGPVPARLADGTIRLLSVDWLLAQPASFILRRRQELPEAAFLPVASVTGALERRTVAVLSYRWLSKEHPDPDGFTLRRVVHFLRTHPPHQAATWASALLGASSYPKALFWDYASLPQKGAETDRTDEERATFKAGLACMAYLYASPNTLVLQQKALPDQSPGMPPLTPYDVSGWCRFEQAVSGLASEGVSKLLVLGVDSRPRAATERPPPDEMSAFFADEARAYFFGAADREAVSEMYRDFYTILTEYNQQHMPWLVKRSDALMHATRWKLIGAIVATEAVVCTVVSVVTTFLPLFMWPYPPEGGQRVLVILGTFLIFELLLFSLVFLPSRLVRARMLAWSRVLHARSLVCLRRAGPAVAPSM